MDFFISLTEGQWVGHCKGYANRWFVLMEGGIEGGTGREGEWRG